MFYVVGYYKKYVKFYERELCLKHNLEVYNNNKVILTYHGVLKSSLCNSDKIPDNLDYKIRPFRSRRFQIHGIEGPN